MPIYYVHLPRGINKIKILSIREQKESEYLCEEEIILLFFIVKRLK